MQLKLSMIELRSRVPIECKFRIMACLVIRNIISNVVFEFDRLRRAHFQIIEQIVVDILQLA